MTLHLLVHLLVRYLFPEFDEHFPSDQLEYLVDPQRPLAPVHPLYGYDLVRAIFILHHLDVGCDGEAGEDAGHDPEPGEGGDGEGEYD